MRISLDSNGAKYYTFSAQGHEALKGVVPNLVTPSGDPANEEKFNAWARRRDQIEGGEANRIKAGFDEQAKGVYGQYLQREEASRQAAATREDYAQELADAEAGAASGTAAEALRNKAQTRAALERARDADYAGEEAFQAEQEAARAQFLLFEDTPADEKDPTFGR